MADTEDWVTEGQGDLRVCVCVCVCVCVPDIVPVSTTTLVHTVDDGHAVGQTSHCLSSYRGQSTVVMYTAFGTNTVREGD